MGNVQIGLVMWVVYGYAIWILAEYLWDWYKQLRRRFERTSRDRRGEQQVKSTAKTDAGEIEPKPPAAETRPPTRQNSTAL